MDSAKDVAENAWESVKRQGRRLSETYSPSISSIHFLLGSMSGSSSPVRDTPARYMGMAMSHQDQENLNIRLGDLNLVYEDCDWLVGTSMPRLIK